MAELDKYGKRLSRYLSLILRHKPEELGITLDREGWVGIYELLHACGVHGRPMTRALLQDIVDNDDKQRFTIRGERIRAAQGHSLESVKIDYVAIEPPTLLYHGTSTRVLPLVREDGLKKMKRNHVHLSPDVATASKVGARHGNVVVIPVLAREMWSCGYLFYLSDNGVWLTDRVPNRFLNFGELDYE
jgi:putative RNA 2'-phosphotransferase